MGELWEKLDQQAWNEITKKWRETGGNGWGWRERDLERVKNFITKWDTVKYEIKTWKGKEVVEFKITISPSPVTSRGGSSNKLEMWVYRDDDAYYQIDVSGGYSSSSYFKCDEMEGFMEFFEYLMSGPKDFFN